MLQWRFDGAGLLEDSQRNGGPNLLLSGTTFWNLHCDEWKM